MNYVGTSLVYSTCNYILGLRKEKKIKEAGVSLLRSGFRYEILMYGYM